MSPAWSHHPFLPTLGEGAKTGKVGPRPAESPSAYFSFLTGQLAGTEAGERPGPWVVALPVSPGCSYAFAHARVPGPSPGAPLLGGGPGIRVMLELAG